MSVGSRSTQQEHRGEKFLSTVAVEFLGSTVSSSGMPLSLLMDDHVYYGVLHYQDIQECETASTTQNDLQKGQ